MLPGFPYKQKLQERCFKQFPYDIYHCQGCKMPMENTDKFFFSFFILFSWRSVEILQWQNCQKCTNSLTEI